MQFKTVIVLVVVLLITLSGCAGLGPQTNDSSNDTEGDANRPESVDDEPDGNGSDLDNESDERSSNGSNKGTSGSGEKTESDENSISDGTDENEIEDNESGSGVSEKTNKRDNTADAEWSPPEEPNRPLERKDDGADRIKSIKFVDTESASNGEGYSNFNLEVVANTSMESVDPPEHGDVVGEPYFFVKINEGTDNQKIVERTGEIEMTKNGTFHIPVRPDGLAEFGEHEQLTVEVFLLDEDKDWDDVYDAGSETIHFNPETDEGSE